MKETGIIRKIDELGRIVLPKEIRRTLGIKDGEDLEIFVDHQGIYLQKHSRLLLYDDLVKELCELASSEMNFNIMITDREKVIASSMPEFLEVPFNYQLSNLLETREEYESPKEENIWEHIDRQGYYYVTPIIISSEVIGFVILFQDQSFLSYMKNFAKFLTKIIGNKIDIL